MERGYQKGAALGFGSLLKKKKWIKVCEFRVGWGEMSVGS